MEYRENGIEKSDGRRQYYFLPELSFPSKEHVLKRAASALVNVCLES